MGEKKNGSGVIWAIVVVVLALMSYGTYKYIKKDTIVAETPVTVPVETPVTHVTSVTTPTTPSPTPVTSSASYKDGSYTAMGGYLSPGGAEQVSVSLTLKNDFITSATAVSMADRPESKKFQAKFIGGFQALVMGKKINEVKLDKVSGSSLTPGGFNDALTKIKVQAKV